MSTDTRPPLLQLGGEESFRRYRREFQRLYQSEVSPITDVLGNLVLFPEHSCRHVCFKGDVGDRYSRSRRENWSQERAERIGWIQFALCDLRTEVRPNDHDPDNRLNYIFIAEADPPNGLEQEYFVVVAERSDRVTMTFITAYAIDHAAWRKYRQAGAALYPQKKKKGG